MSTEAETLAYLADRYIRLNVDGQSALQEALNRHLHENANLRLPLRFDRDLGGSGIDNCSSINSSAQDYEKLHAARNTLASVIRLQAGLVKEMRTVLNRMWSRDLRSRLPSADLMQLQAKVRSFEKSLAFKEIMIEKIPEVFDRREAMLYISSWIHEPYIHDSLE